MSDDDKFLSATDAWPKVWRKDLTTLRAYQKAILVSAVVAAVLCLGSIGDPVLAALFSWFVILLGMAGIYSFAMLAWPKARRLSFVSKRLLPDVGATTFSQGRGVITNLIVVNAIFVGGVQWFLFSTYTILPYEDYNSPWVLVVYLLPIAAPLALLVAISRLLLFAFASRKINGVGLSPEGVYRWNWGICSFYGWDSIKNFAVRKGGSARVRIEYTDPAHRHGGPEETRLGALPYVRRGRQAEIQLGLLSTHPSLVYQMLFFYLQNSELRSELGTEAAAERLRTGDFPEVIEQIKKHGRALSKGEARRPRSR